MSERRRAFVGVFTATFCTLLAVGAVLPVLPQYVKGPLGDGDVTVGIVVGCYAVSGLLLRPLAGRLADTRGRRRTALVGMATMSAAGFLYLPHLGLWNLLAARLLVGVGEGFTYTAGSAWVVDLAPPARRGRILGLYGLAVWGGLALGPLIGSLIHAAAGYAEVWLFAATVPLLGILAASGSADRFVPLAHAEPHPLVAREALRPGIAAGLAAVGYATLAAFGVLLLDHRGISGGAAVFAAFGGAIIAARVVGGGLPDRIGAAKVAIGATFGEAVGLIGIAAAGSLPVALLGAVAMGAGFSLLNPSLMLIAVARIPQSARGAALGTFTACFDAGVGVGAPLAGATAALAGYGGAFLLAAALAVTSAVVICLMVLGRGGAAAAQRPATH